VRRVAIVVGLYVALGLSWAALWVRITSSANTQPASPLIFVAYDAVAAAIIGVFVCAAAYAGVNSHRWKRTSIVGSTGTGLIALAITLGIAWTVWPGRLFTCHRGTMDTVCGGPFPVIANGWWAVADIVAMTALASLLALVIAGVARLVVRHPRLASRPVP
jgi:hypothetical protein